MRFSTKAIHLEHGLSATISTAVIPISQKSIFNQAEGGSYRENEYSKAGKSSCVMLEKGLAFLENGKYGLVFSSGATATAAILSILKPGDNVIKTEDFYGDNYQSFEKICSLMDISITYVNGTHIDAFKSKITPKTKLIWVETLSNSLLKTVDLLAVETLCKNNNILLVADNTLATPYFQHPLDFGADIVIHNSVRYLGGYSDINGGAIITNDKEICKKIRFYQNTAGGTSSTFDSWLVLGGIKTLAIRMKQHEKNAKSIALMLNEHPQVLSVIYPGLLSYPQCNIVNKQMKGSSGVISFKIKGGLKAAKMFLKNLKFFSVTETIGGVESSACYLVKETANEELKKEHVYTIVEDNVLIRLSIGIEDLEDLISDLSNALIATDVVDLIPQYGS